MGIVGVVEAWAFASADDVVLFVFPFEDLFPGNKRDDKPDKRTLPAFSCR